MLRKSLSSAILLSAVGVLAFTLTSALVNMLIPYWISGDFRAAIANPERLRNAGDVAALAALLLGAFLILVALGAYWLYRFFGEDYYGGRGAARWALFGALFALFIKGSAWLPQGLSLLKNLLWVVSVFAAFFIARRLIPLRRS